MDSDCTSTGMTCTTEPIINIRHMNYRRAVNRIRFNIESGVNEYEKDISNLSDAELWQHIWDDKECPPVPADFCVKELKRRFFKPNGEDPDEIELAEDIKDWENFKTK